MTHSDNDSIYIYIHTHTHTHTLDIAVIHIYLRQTWLFIKKEFIIQMLNSLIIFHQILKILLAILRDLKEFLNIF